MLEILQLPHGPGVVVHAAELLELICVAELLGDEHEDQGWSLLLASPEFRAEVMKGVQCRREAALMVVGQVWHLGIPAHCQVLAAMPGLAEALTDCCSYNDCREIGSVLDSLLCWEEGRGFLDQHPALMQALASRLDTDAHFADSMVELLEQWAGWEDVEDAAVEWFLQQPLLVEAVLRMLVNDDSYCARKVLQWLRREPALMEALLRQPPLVAKVLQGLVRHNRRRQRRAMAPMGDDRPCIQQLLVEGLATPELAPQALSVMLGLLGSGDSSKLSVGVFEAVGVIQSKLGSCDVEWGGELAAVAARAAPVVHAEQQLQALCRGVGEVRIAAAAAARVTHRAMLKSIGST
jgi:hypothetical protein